MLELPRRLRLTPLNPVHPVVEGVFKRLVEGNLGLPAGVALNFEASPSRISTSDGRIRSGSFSIVTSTSASVIRRSSSSLIVMPVPEGNVVDLARLRFGHRQVSRPSTVSRTSVKSRTESRLPTRMTGSRRPALISASCMAKFEVTKTGPRRGPVWLKPARADRLDAVALEILVGEEVLGHLRKRRRATAGAVGFPR